MKIKYLDSDRLYYAFLAGGDAVISNQNHLNRINVFPVADADTGANMASTMRSIVEGTKIYPSIKDTFRSLADAALMGARGNSGIIFAQFVHGCSADMLNEKRLCAKGLTACVKKAVDYAYASILEPMEGTILTVMKDWMQAIEKQAEKSGDLVEILHHSLLAAQSSLAQTAGGDWPSWPNPAWWMPAPEDSSIFWKELLGLFPRGKLQDIAKDNLNWFDAELYPAVHSTHAGTAVLL